MPINLTELLESPIVRKFLWLFFVLILVYILLIISKKGLNSWIQSTENKYRARKAANVFSYLLVILSVVFIFSEQLGTFGVVLGFTGAGIAFALQDLVLSFAGWIYIVFTNTVAVGQRVKIGALKGDIIDIGILSTTMMEMGEWVNGDLYNGRIINLANNYVFKEKIQNYSSQFPFLWDEIEIPLRHGSDFVLAKKLFGEIALEICGDFAQKSQSKWNELTNKYNVENAEVNSMVSLVFDENWITFTIRYVVDFKKRRSTKDLIYSRVLEEITKYPDEIQIATSAMEVTLKK